MAQEYTVEKVSQQEARKHENAYGITYYKKVMLAGHEKPVSIGKKTPDALKKGDTVYGAIVPTTYDTDNFKAERPQQGQAFQGKDQNEIKAQWAIGRAYEKHDRAGKDFWEDVESDAGLLFLMVGRIKMGGDSPSTTSAVDQVFPVNDKEEINLDDIPF